MEGPDTTLTKDNKIVLCLCPHPETCLRGRLKVDVEQSDTEYQRNHNLKIHPICIIYYLEDLQCVVGQLPTICMGISCL